MDRAYMYMKPLKPWIRKPKYQVEKEKKKEKEKEKEKGKRKKEKEKEKEKEKAKKKRENGKGKRKRTLRNAHCTLQPAQQSCMRFWPERNESGRKKKGKGNTYNYIYGIQQ